MEFVFIERRKGVLKTKACDLGRFALQLQK